VLTPGQDERIGALQSFTAGPRRRSRPPSQQGEAPHTLAGMGGRLIRGDRSEVCDQNLKVV
jgi:hypothetical protein